MGVAAPGMITPQSELNIPSSVTIRKSGTRTTVCGIMSVPITSSRTVVRPRNWYFDSAKAAMELTSSMMAVDISVMKVEFQK